MNQLFLPYLKYKTEPIIPVPVARNEVIVNVGPKTFIGIVNKLNKTIDNFEIWLSVYCIKLVDPYEIKRLAMNRNIP